VNSEILPGPWNLLNNCSCLSTWTPENQDLDTHILFSAPPVGLHMLDCGDSAYGRHLVEDRGLDVDVNPYNNRHAISAAPWLKVLKW
jgi:hypothetical protein